ncbi:MAG: DUF4956 domain-containing protein [Patescibacteria group bacterium]|nr:DUF4956 domain-containing protein [Patescibacteria group bacterium]MDD5490169.1 DUF4956 domain-containing protein [Patescibacteria group bacterium]
MSISSFLDPIVNPVISIGTVIFSFLLAFLFGVIISLVYKKIQRGFSYDSYFCFTLVMIVVIVTAIMITIGSNLALSLGLIGSLSIIRFRTAIKNTMDMAFLFWSIAMGLAVGAQNYAVAIVGIIIIGFIVFFLSRSKLFFKSNTDYVMVVKTKSQEMQAKISEILDKYGLSWKIKSAFTEAPGSEITYSIYSKKDLNVSGVVAAVQELSAVESVSLLSPDTNLFI